MVAIAALLPVCRPYLRRYFCAIVQLPSDWLQVVALYEVGSRSAGLGCSLVPPPALSPPGEVQGQFASPRGSSALLPTTGAPPCTALPETGMWWPRAHSLGDVLVFLMQEMRTGKCVDWPRILEMIALEPGLRAASRPLVQACDEGLRPDGPSSLSDRSWLGERRTSQCPCLPACELL